MSYLLLDGDWDVDGRMNYSWYILEDVMETVSYSWSILEAVGQTLSYSWEIYGSVLKALSYSWEIINSLSNTVAYAWEIFRQAGSSRAREIFRKEPRGTTFTSSGQNPLIGDVKRHRWWKSK